MLYGVCAVGGAPPASADEPGLLRIAHLSPDTPAVDVSVQPAGTTPVTTDAGLGYGAVSDWRRLAPGSYAVALRRAGAPLSTPPSLSVLVDVSAGSSQTLAAVGHFADLRLRVLTEDLTPPAPARARVRVVDAATAGALDVSLPGGTALATALPFAAAGGWTEVPAGAVGVRIAAAGGPPADVQVDLAAGSVTTLLALDRPGGGLTLRPVLDAGGTSLVPVGPVPAGGGGTARGFPVGVLASVVAAALLVGARPARRALTLVALVAGAVLLPTPASAPALVSPATGPRPVVVAAATTPGVPAPVRLQIPAAGVDSALPAIGLDGAGALVPPADVGAAGWFAQGAAPGDAGPAVIAGHVDSVTGPGVFFRLRTLVPGDPVVVTRADGSVVRFAVTRVERFAKAAFPTAAVYGPTPDPQLRLVTCGGAFDRAARSYVDDVVVFAHAT